jgi:DNA-binding SARP family transcriptional activator
MLGPLQVRDGEGEMVALPRRQQRALLGALLVRAGEVVSTDRLVDDLWGESPPPAALGSLQNTVSQLRKLLGATTLRTQPPGYVLDVADDDVDARRFERLVAEAVGRTAVERAAALREALALWHGPALADLADEPWAAVEAERLDELRLTATEEQLDAELELGRHAALVARIEALAAEHPLRERLWRQLALALYRSGRQADALEACRSARSALDELGLEPSAELRQLERDLLQQSPRLAAPVEAVEETPAEVAGERRVVSVLAAAVPDDDDPEALRVQLDELLAAANAALGAHGGAIERFGPDGLIAVFGAEGGREDDALRAVRAAVELHLAAGAPTAVATGEALIADEPRVAGSAVARAAGLARVGVGVLVDPRTYELVRDAVTAETSGQVARVLSVSAVRPQPGLDTPLVGRTKELARLRASFDAAVEQRRCVATTVVGEPGIGKTRLARELARRLDAAVLVGRCAAYGEGATFLPLVDALRDVDAAAALAGDDDAELVAKRIAGLAGAAQEPGSLGESYWAVRRLLEELARRRPLALVLDDVHWADPALLDLVEYLRDRVADAPLFVLCVARPELLDGRPSWTAGALPLEPLADQETRELIAVTAELEDESRERIVELAEGNPLYAQQLATYAAESGKALEPGAMPATIEAVLAGRLGRLDAGERATLQRAAVVGREFSRGAVAALAPPDLAVDAHLLALARRGFVRAAPDAPPGDDAYRFHHVLLRDAAYATLTKEQRADLHEKVANWLDRDGPGDDAIVGYHLEQTALLRQATEAGANVAEIAGERLARAGFQAVARGDTPAAIGLLQRAVALLPPGARRAELRWELAIALRINGRPAKATEQLNEAAVEADAHGEQRMTTRIAVERIAWQLYSEEAAPDDVLAVARNGLEVLEREHDLRGQGRAWLAIQAAHNFRCEMDLMGEAAARAETCARRSNFSTAGSLGAQAYALYHGSTPAPAAVSRCLELLDRVQQRTGRANVLGALGALHGFLARFDEARDLLEESRAAHGEAGLTLVQYTSWAECAFEVNRLSGAARDAEAIAQSSLEALLELGERAYAATRAVQLADLKLDLGDVDEAARLVRMAERHVSNHDVLVRFMILRVRARLDARAGNSGRAEAVARRAVGISETTDDLSARGDTMVALAEILMLADRPSEAAAAAEGAEALYDRKGNVAGRDRARIRLRQVQPV